MTSEIRVNKIENRSGLGTVTFADTGVDLAGIVTATTFSGSGASLTALPAAQLSGTLPAISAANLTNVPAANLTGTLPALNAASLTQIPAANIVGVCTSGLTKTGGFGVILQVVSTFVQASSSYGTSANSHYTLSPLNTAITPVGTNSKFLVSAQISGEAQNDSNANIFLRLIRNTASGAPGSDNVAICHGDNGSNNSAPENTSAFHGYYNANNDSTISTAYIGPYLDSPSVAAGGNLSYKVQVWLQNSNTFYLNRTVTQYNADYGDYLPSFVTVMEIAQ